MSLKTAKKIDNSRYELEILIDGATFCDAINKVYKKEGKNISIPGFRKGKAPLYLVEKMYGESVFFEDALNLLYSDALEAAAEEAGVEIVDDKMDFDLVSISKADGVDFKVTLTVVPEATLGDYKGLKAERVTPVVTDDEVDAEINQMANRNARMVSVEDRAAALEDIAVIDFEGFVDDVAFEGGKGESYSLTLGSGQFIPGFEEQIVGHNVGEEFDVNVTFPEDYQAEELKGKAAVFKVKLHEIKHRELPVIDDEFAKDVSEFDTLAELKEDIKKHQLEHKAHHADEDVENALIDQIVEGMKVEIPDAMIEARCNQSLQDFAYRLQMQGLNLETYLQYMGTNADDFKASFRPQAEKQVKMRLALETIVKLEKLEVSDEDVAAEITKMAEAYGVSEEQVKSAVPVKEIKKDLAVTKALELVKSSAVVTEVEKKTEKKPAAKKPAAKKAATGEKKTDTAAKKPAAKKPAAKKPAAKKTAEKKED
ncbi:MAG: trigger factor [Clostridia bacterium]|nr:trigger factor [Clostridia bacterium]